jgi:YegS/Rv2252/BmrU family lipid kinase
LRPVVLAELSRLFPGIQVLESGAPGDGTVLARAAADAKLVVAVGGDGTVREVVAGLAGTGTPFAVVPIGSGNDFLKTVGVSADPLEACRVAAHGRPRTIDAVRVFAAGPGHESSHVYANAAGFGFDARVAQEAGRLSHLRGLPLYVAAVFRAVREYQCPLVRITIDNRTWEQHVLLVAANNGRFYGGGMKIAPEAAPDDGLLEICVIDAVGRLTIFRRLPSFVRGTHTGLKEVTMYRSARLELEFLEPVMVQLDGDLLPDSGLSRFRLEVLPGALRVMSG